MQANFPFILNTLTDAHPKLKVAWNQQWGEIYWIDTMLKELLKHLLDSAPFHFVWFDEIYLTLGALNNYADKKGWVGGLPNVYTYNVNVTFYLLSLSMRGGWVVKKCPKICLRSYWIPPYHCKLFCKLDKFWKLVWQKLFQFYCANFYPKVRKNIIVSPSKALIKKTCQNNYKSKK